MLMARMADWQRDMQDAVRREMWTLKGPTQVVKVVPGGGAAATTLGGYITLGKFLLNKTPAQIETALGLPAKYLASGARVYHFTRLPHVSEYEYELTAEFPDGLAFNPAHSNPAYPPGSRSIHQWRIKPGVQIPVDARNFLDLKPGQIFPYSWLV
jgi:predicted methyltransferase